VTSETRPLAIHPWPASRDDLERLRAAKVQMDVDWLIQPSRPTSGGTGRILGWGQVPPWVRDYLVIDPTDPEDIKQGILWATDNWVGDDRAVTVTDILSNIFGGEVVELEEENEDS
jgi:hypothetical protein